jgi:hypothetical protein
MECAFSMSVIESTKNLSHVFKNNYEPDIFGVHEACDELNNASQNVVAAYIAEHGPEVWLVKLNTYDQVPHVRPYRDAAMVHNFSADYVVPVYDPALHELCMRWGRSAMRDGKESLNAILDGIDKRVQELGGTHLLWS